MHTGQDVPYRRSDLLFKDLANQEHEGALHFSLSPLTGSLARSHRTTMREVFYKRSNP
jgi:hypothetical protein